MSTNKFKIKNMSDLHRMIDNGEAALYMTDKKDAGRIVCKNIVIDFSDKGFCKITNLNDEVKEVDLCFSSYYNLFSIKGYDIKKYSSLVDNRESLSEIDLGLQEYDSGSPVVEYNEELIILLTKDFQRKKELRKTLALDYSEWLCNIC